MPAVPKTWQVAPQVPGPFLERFPNWSPLLVQVLYNRRIRDLQAAERFMAGQGPEGDPFLMQDMGRAVDVLIRSIKRREPIAVYGDFDADGVTATALLVQTLTGLGADVQHYIPHRVDEGYGLNLGALRGLYGRGVRVVVTVDCGIRAVDEIEKARRGLEFVVTDHHSVGPVLPFALAVINPKREDCPYPFKQLAGVGVAFKLAQALMQEARTCKIPVHVEEASLLDLVAIGTVADLVPLVGENRLLVRKGLEVLNEERREGARALLRVSRAQRGEVSAATIGYRLGPRINAAGRLGDASLSYDLLLASDPVEADRLAGRLSEQNRRRQDMTAQAYVVAEKMALARGEDVPLLYAADETFMSGIVGLVAGRLTESYYRPSVVVEKGDELCKGSCRSIDGFHVAHALDECGDLLVRHGGHAAAAGFTVRSDLLDALAGRLFGIAQRELGHRELAPSLQIDAVVPLPEANWTTADWLAKLEPCGNGNPMAVFLSRDVEVLHAEPVGRESQHLRMDLAAADGVLDAIAFRMGDRAVAKGDHLDVVYHLEANKWNGERRLQLNVLDIRPTEGEDVTCDT